MKTKPSLFLIPSPIGEAPFDSLFPSINAEIANQIKFFFVEDERTARRFLIQLGVKTPIDEWTFFSLRKHNKIGEALAFLREQFHLGHDIGLISDAGTPCVADPGHRIVEEAHHLKMKVKPLVGPNSILLALMASGMNGQSFAFNGYLPINKEEREKQLRFFETLFLKNGQTQIFIETPYRNQHLMQSICTVCQPNTQVCIAVNLTTKEEYIEKNTVAQWRKKDFKFLHKQPTIFLLGK